MLRFFRTLRRKLLEEGHLNKYFWYAIGEVFLVVIGILIALQVNTWNEGRKRSNLEQYLLLELKNEVLENLILIESDIERNVTGMAHSTALIQKMVTRELEQSESVADSLIAGIYEMSSFEPKSGVITDIINTGKLDVIQNDSLRVLISNWDYQIIDMMDDAEIRDVTLFEQLFPFLAKNYPLVNIQPYLESYIDADLAIQKVGLRSTHSPNYTALYSMEAQGLVYNHAVNQEYLINALQIYRTYLEGMRELINMELE